MGGGREAAIIPPLLAPPPPHCNQPNNPNDLLLELDEGDVVWPQTTSNSHTHSTPSSSSSSLLSNSPSPTPSPSPSPSPSPRPKLGLALGLSAAFSPDPLPLLLRRAHAAVAVTPIHPSSNDHHRPFISGAGRRLQMSAPVNVPIWPGRRRQPEGDRDRRHMMWDLREGEEKEKEKEGEGEGEEEEEEDDDGDRTMVPPHILAARSRAMSFSVFEGVGRTLKGRDLRQVRNAVLQKTGFLD